MYEDQRVPYIFCFLDPELAGYAKGNEIVEFVEYYPNNGEYCTVAPGVQSNLTYNEIVEMNLEGDFEIVEEEGGDIGNTAAFWYYYDADTTVVFYWYEDHSPYTTPAESVTAFYD